jgi:RNA polymerase sigma-70 factor (ECF subfamily)
LARIGGGDTHAAVQCIDRYGPLVWSLVRARIRSTAAAEEIVEDIFAELWKRAARYDPRLCSEALFVTAIARRRLLARMRTTSLSPASEGTDEQLADMDQRNDFVAASGEARLAAKALVELDAGQREVVLLSVVRGMSQTEIAAAVRQPLASVKALLRRGLIEVRDVIARRGMTAVAGGSE